jgi:hypothetical protein
LLYLASARRQLRQGLLFRWLFPNASEFGSNLTALSSGNSVQDIALLMQQAALPRSCRKQLRNGCEQAIMAISDDQIDVDRSSCPQVLEQASPSLFVLLGAGSQGEHFFVSRQIQA